MNIYVTLHLPRCMPQSIPIMQHKHSYSVVKIGHKGANVVCDTRVRVPQTPGYIKNYEILLHFFQKQPLKQPQLFIKIAQKVAKLLGFFYTIIFHQNLSKIDSLCCHAETGQKLFLLIQYFISLNFIIFRFQHNHGRRLHRCREQHHGQQPEVDTTTSATTSTTTAATTTTVFIARTSRCRRRNSRFGFPTGFSEQKCCSEV